MTWAPPSKPGDSDPLIGAAKHKLRNYKYGRDNLATDDTTNQYTNRFGAALRAYAVAVNEQIRKGIRKGPYVNVNGVFDWTVKTQLGFLAPAPAPTPKPPAHRPIYYFSAPGSGATNTVGPANDVGVWAQDVLNINHIRLTFRMGGYLGLLGGDPGLSYIEVIADEAADLERQIENALRAEGMDADNPDTWLNTTIEFWFGAYSQSADGMKKAIARQFGDGGRFEKLRSRINGLILFGDPSRQPGPVKGQSAGYSPPGWGIARYLAPKWLEAISYSITTNGDMYACTADDTLLPGFYRWFIEAETSLSFVEFSAGIVIPAIASYLGIVGPLLGGLFGGAGAAIISGATGVGLPFLTQMLNSGAVEDPYITKLRNDLSAKGLLTIGGITKLFKTLAALPGIDTHGRYWEPRPEFGGRTGIQVGCEIMAGFRR
jgi:hypothetical protein